MPKRSITLAGYGLALNLGSTEEIVHLPTLDYLIRETRS